MRMPGLHHRSGQLLALLGLAIVLPVWVVVSLANRWFRLGNGRIAFDWDENPSGGLMVARPNRRREPAISEAPSPPEALAGRDPLWDRWLDG